MIKIPTTRAEDLLTEIQEVPLNSCKDAVLKGNIYKWCRSCLGGSWSKLALEKLNIKCVR